MSKILKSFLTKLEALKAASDLANRDKIPYYIYKRIDSVTLTNFKPSFQCPDLITVYPYEPSEMTNKENN